MMNLMMNVEFKTLCLRIIGKNVIALVAPIRAPGRSPELFYTDRDLRIGAV